VDRNLAIKKKAQALIQKGQIDAALAEFDRLFESGDKDPYDFILVADLLAKRGAMQEAVRRYRQAMAEYTKAELFKNAIAVCKKILRLDPRRFNVHRALGDFYVLEELWGEAVPHFLTYLDAADGDERFGPTFLETLDRAVSVVGMQVEAALRLADHYERVNRGDRAAELLRDLAGRVEGSGVAEELVLELRRRAEEASVAHASADPSGEAPLPWTGVDEQICSDLETRVSDSYDRLPRPESLMRPTGGTPPVSALEEKPTTRMEPVDSLDWDAVQAEPATEPAPPGADTPSPAAENPSPITQAEAPRGEAVPEASPETFVVEHHSALTSQTPVEAELRAAENGEAGDEGRVWDLDANGAPPLLEWQEEAVETPRDPEAMYAAGAVERSADAAPETELHPTRLLDRAEDAFARGDWHEAQRLFEHALAEHPLEPIGLSRLVDVARALHDSSAEVRYLILLGDAWIEAGEMEKALPVFVQVQQLDGENGTARRRLARFREMGIPGAEEISPPAGGPIAEVLEIPQSHVTVGPAQSDPIDREWVDLGALLEAFQEGLKNQIAGDDYQSHYDLAVSHRSMGLFEEAISEADQALGAPEVPADLECRARELKGLCLAELERHREAVQEFRSALDRPSDDAERKLSLQYRLAVALESVGEWQQAVEVFEQVLSVTPDYLDAPLRRDRCLQRWIDCDRQDEAA
jgi:tetratricopeptide (TPR) repeat protein